MKIYIIAHPNSKNPRVETDLLNNIHVYVKEPAKDNKANFAIIKTIAQHYNVPKSSVKIVAGLKNKSKILDISI